MKTQKSILFECEMLNVKNIANNKKFLKNGKSFFSKKSSKFRNIYLIEKSKLSTDNFAKYFNEHFQNLVPNSDLKVPNNLLFQTPGNSYKVLITIIKYQNHPSIKKQSSQSFFFQNNVSF